MGWCQKLIDALLTPFLLAAFRQPCWNAGILFASSCWVWLQFFPIKNMFIKTRRMEILFGYSGVFTKWYFYFLFQGRDVHFEQTLSASLVNIHGLKHILNTLRKEFFSDLKYFDTLFFFLFFFLSFLPSLKRSTNLGLSQHLWMKIYCHFQDDH